jgi:hypothetical protein
MKRRQKYVSNRQTKTKREKKRYSLIVTFEKKQKERKTGIHQTDRVVCSIKITNLQKA